MTSLPVDDDRQLWARMATGDADSLGSLFDRYHRAVYNHCFRLTASWSTADELSSQVFMEAWRQRVRTQLTGDTALPWLLTVATNLSRNEHRSWRRRQRLIDLAGPPEPVPDPADDVAARIDDERQMADLLTEVRALPRAEREALALCVWSGISYAEAAATLNIAESSVRSRVSRARARLAESVGARTPEPSIGTTPVSSLSQGEQR